MGIWVIEYMLNYSLDGVLWEIYRNFFGKVKVRIKDNDIYLKCDLFIVIKFDVDL